MYFGPKTAGWGSHCSGFLAHMSPIPENYIVFMKSKHTSTHTIYLVSMQSNMLEKCSPELSMSLLTRNCRARVNSLGTHWQVLRRCIWVWHQEARPYSAAILFWANREAAKVKSLSYLSTCWTLCTAFHDKHRKVEVQIWLVPSDQAHVNSVFKLRKVCILVCLFPVPFPSWQFPVFQHPHTEKQRILESHMYTK